jgi:hypothetical protein
MSFNWYVFELYVYICEKLKDGEVKSFVAEL